MEIALVYPFQLDRVLAWPLLRNLAGITFFYSWSAKSRIFYIREFPGAFHRGLDQYDRKTEETALAGRQERGIIVGCYPN